MKKCVLFLFTAVIVFYGARFGYAQTSHKKQISPKGTIITETFEAGSKNSYDAEYVTFTTGSWYLVDALVGTSTSDRKFDAKSVRIRNLGTLSMNFNCTGGIGHVTVYHALYGTDAASSWELYYSIDDGVTWTKSGFTIATQTTVLTAAEFDINISGNVRLEIRKVSGDANRLNIDNISIESYTETYPATRDNNLAMGNPNDGVTDVLCTANYLMEKYEYTLSYHSKYGRPNWVSWHLSTAWLGSTPRPTTFTSDNTLPPGWYVVQPTDFAYTGFDRGHMCPASDRDFNETEIRNTFILTNIIAQAPYNNQQTWRLLEEYCRTLAERGNELYIICGPFGSGGTGSNGGVTDSIALGKIRVPSHVWKVILVLPNGEDDVSRVNTSTRVIAVWIPNIQSLTTNWGSYRTTVDFIESQTGFNFFSNVPLQIQSVIEAKTDNGPTN